MLEQLAFFLSIAFSGIAWDCLRPIPLAGTPTAAAGRRVAASARPPQLPLPRVGILRPGRRVF